MKFLRKNLWWIITLLIVGGVIGGGAYLIFRPKPVVAPETATVTRTTLNKHVDATGVVKAAEEFSLDFDTNGRVRRVFVATGDRVTAGQVLAELEAGDLELQVQRAKDGLRAAQANLAQRTAGEIPQVIRLAETDIHRTDVSLAEAQVRLENLRRSSELNIRSAELNIQAKQLALTQAQQEQAGNVAVEMAELALTQAQYDLQSARVNAEMNVRSQEAAVEVARANRSSAVASLDVKQAGVRKEDRAPFDAAIAEAKTSVTIAESQLSKARITAPADGVVTNVAISPGESGSPRTGSSAVTVLGMHAEIEADVSETDIVHIKIGAPVDITLDAFGDEQTFPGTIISINPAQTVIQDIVYYKVRVSLTTDVENVRPGMSANLSILEDSRLGALVVPSRAVQEVNGVTTVEVIAEDGTRVTRTVTVGLRGDSGMVEVTTGLNEGERVVVGGRRK